MHGRHMKKAPRLLAIRGVAALILVLALSISSFATVMANTVSANVIDGDQSYTFNMSSTDLDEILEQAEEMGLEPLGPLDVAERVEGTTTVVVRRGVNLTVREAGKENLLVAYRGDTVEQVLLENSIVLKDADEITPARETVVEGDTQVEIRRACQVVVLADGKQTTVPQTVEDVLKKFQVELDEDDRVEPEAKTKVAEGMEITVRRVEVKEEVKTEEVPFETQYQDTDSLYEGETQVKTQGVAGEKEVTYQVTFVDGEEESREAASEKVTKEPVAEVVLRGTAEREQSGAGGSGTFVDLYGNTVSYSSVMSGTCTAYSVPGGTTSLGWDAVYGVIAVNPNIIPYGTKMYVTSPDGSVVYGYGVAGDTGGACMAGDIIADLCYNTIEECSQIGRREMVIYILS